jgi:hypothetical protein
MDSFNHQDMLHSTSKVRERIFLYGKNDDNNLLLLLL